MFVWPQTNECGFAGVAYVPGKHSYLNGTLSVQVMTHEVGHNFGISHSNARDCVVGGSRTWLAATDELHDEGLRGPVLDDGQQRAAPQPRLAPRRARLAERVPEGRRHARQQLHDRPVLRRAARSSSSGSRAATARFFDLDVRTPYGTFDTFTAGSPATAGTTIRLGVGSASPTTSPKMTELLDTTPSTTDLKDAPLLVGKTVTDPVSTISFKTLSVGSGGVTVEVKEGIKPGTPGSFAATATDDPRVDLTLGRGDRQRRRRRLQGHAQRHQRRHDPGPGHVVDRHRRRFRHGLHVHGRRRRHVGQHRHGGEQVRHHAGRPRPDPTPAADPDA